MENLDQQVLISNTAENRAMQATMKQMGIKLDETFRMSLALLDICVLNYLYITPSGMIKIHTFTDDDRKVNKICSFTDFDELYKTELITAKFDDVVYTEDLMKKIGVTLNEYFRIFLTDDKSISVLARFDKERDSDLIKIYSIQDDNRSVDNNISYVYKDIEQLLIGG